MDPSAAMPGQGKAVCHGVQKTHPDRTQPVTRQRLSLLTLYMHMCLVCVCACVSCRYAPCLSEDPVQQTRCRSRQEESQDGRPRGVSGTSVSFLPARGHMQVGALACACIATLNIAACFKRFECRRMPCISLNVGQGQRGAWDPL